MDTIRGLQIRHCSKTYGGTHALCDVTFDVQPGQIVGLVGANGAGKTTLLHALFGLIRLDAGEVTWEGTPTSSDSARRSMSFMPDDLPRPLRLSGRELIELNCQLYQRPVPDLGAMATELDLAGRLDHPLAGYSHGMRRKIDLMAALAVAPQLLVLDEPFSGLDPGMVAQLQGHLRQLRAQGVAVLVSSHDLELVEALADDVVILDAGEVIARGNAQELAEEFESHDLRSAFLAMMQD